MKITSISSQVKSPDRVNISIDGKYRFSLDIFQISELGIKVGKEYSEKELLSIETESQFGKLYSRALEYCLMRPHSTKEAKDYLWRKTRATTYKSRSGELKERIGVSQAIADRALARLKEKGYLDDVKFARWWIENRNQKRGSSLRKLTSELQSKGVERTIIERATADSSRNDTDELAKVIAKKAHRYDDERKLVTYLAGQGFRYDDIKQTLATLNDQ